jgi:hypothetical protein
LCFWMRPCAYNHSDEVLPDWIDAIGVPDFHVALPRVAKGRMFCLDLVLHV